MGVWGSRAPQREKAFPTKTGMCKAPAAGGSSGEPPGHSGASSQVCTAPVNAEILPGGSVITQWGLIAGPLHPPSIHGSEMFVPRGVSIEC